MPESKPPTVVEHAEAEERLVSGAGRQRTLRYRTALRDVDDPNRTTGWSLLSDHDRSRPWYEDVLQGETAERVCDTRRYIQHFERHEWFIALDILG
ncbi:hypothetical protein HRbin27_01914 [bacterium HR27]|nr:hypothetical protein HRbin27_01914 [bacterium HR27]